MSLGYHYHRKSRKKITTVMDKVVYFFSACGILILVPQLVQIWVHHNTSGVSLVTWSGFTMGTLFWLLYGIIHGERPLIAANLAAFIVNVSIVVGIMVNQPV